MALRSASTGARASTGAHSAIDGRRALHKLWGHIEKESMSSASFDRKVERVGAASIDFSKSDCDTQEASERLKDGEKDGEESDAVGPNPEDDPELVTLGSALHASGECKPCHFFRDGKVCIHGKDCKFCHYHPLEVRKRPGKKMRMKMARRAARIAASAELDAKEGGENGAAAPSGGPSAQGATGKEPEKSKMSL